MTLHLNGFSQCSPCPQNKGQWKHPRDRQTPGASTLDHWVHVAKTLERGCFDALFFADVHGTYDVYRGSRRDAIRHGVQIPCYDPTVIIPALAAQTKHLGFATTYSTSYHAPYHTAKLFSTLDHLTGGRVAWNVVTSYLRDAEQNGMGRLLPHDERYDRAEEYMEVVYKLWEGSWDENAVVADRDADVLIDPDGVHEIHHKGRYFDVLGPHLCDPSPQRTPVIYQAGSSERGIDFGAKHGEALFVVFPNTEVCRTYCDRYRERMAHFGRSAGNAKLLMAVSVVVAETDEKAQHLFDEMKACASPEGAMALFGGWTGIDLSVYRPGDRLDFAKGEQMQFMAEYFAGVDPDKDWTFGEMTEYLSLSSVSSVIVGSPQRVADELERWHREGGVDGFNLVPPHTPADFDAFVDLVVPELQKRGLLRCHYESSTLRGHYFGKDQARLCADHPGAAHRPRN